MRAKPSAPIAAVGVAGELVHGARSAVGDLGLGRRLGQARRVLRGVVVELVAGHDLARAVELEAGRVVADDRDLEVAGAGEVRLDEGERVVAERQLEGRRRARRGRGRGSSRPSCRGAPA